MKIFLGLTMSILLLGTFQNCSDVAFDRAPNSSIDNNLVDIFCAANPLDASCMQDPPPAPPIPFCQKNPNDSICTNAKTVTGTYSVKDVIKKVDLFFVIDDSGSMKPDVLVLGQKLNGFTNVLDSSGIDWQACHTTIKTKYSNSNEARTWHYPSNKKVLKKSDNIDKNTVFVKSMENFSADGGAENGIVAMQEAMKNRNNSSCFREDAQLLFIVISDEDHKSCGGRCNKIGDESYSIYNPSENNQYWQLEGAKDEPEEINRVAESLFLSGYWQNRKSITIHSMIIRANLTEAHRVPARTNHLVNRDQECFKEQESEGYTAFYGLHYEVASALSGGIVGSICSKNYSRELAFIADRTRQTLSSIQLKCAPLLNPTVKKDNANGQRIPFTLIGDKVAFDPPLSNQEVYVSYLCK